MLNCDYVVDGLSLATLTEACRGNAPVAEAGKTWQVWKQLSNGRFWTGQG